MLQWVAERLISLISPISQYQRDRRELSDNALRAISIALNETCIYYRGLENGNSPDPEIENQLCKYWSAAAIPVRHIDRELAITCEHKSRYWLDPEHWDHANASEIIITLEHVRERYQRILNNGRPYPNEA